MNKNFNLTLVLSILGVLASMIIGLMIGMHVLYPTHLDKGASATNEYLYQNIVKFDDMNKKSGYESVKEKIEKDMKIIRNENFQFKNNKEITDRKDKNYINIEKDGIHFNTDKSTCLLIMRKTVVLGGKIYLNGSQKESKVGEDCNKPGVIETRIVFS